MSCGTFLSLPKPRVKAQTPRLKISPKERKSPRVKFRDHPKTNRTDVSADISYLLGLFLARGNLKKESLTIRVPCRSENAPHHRDFLVGYVVPRMERATGEKIKIYGDGWRGYTFHIMISSDFFLRLLETLEYEEGQVCRFAGIPYEIFNASNEVKREFVKGIGDCSGEIDRYIDGSPRVVLRFLNENAKLIEDIVELLLMLSVDIFDVNLSPASERRPDVSARIDELTCNLGSRYGVNVTGRRQKTGRDNMIRIWGEEYYNQIDFYNPLRRTKLLKYLGHS